MAASTLARTGRLPATLIRLAETVRDLDDAQRSGRGVAREAVIEAAEAVVEAMKVPTSAVDRPLVIALGHVLQRTRALGRDARIGLRGDRPGVFQTGLASVRGLDEVERYIEAAYAAFVGSASAGGGRG